MRLIDEWKKKDQTKKEKTQDAENDRSNSFEKIFSWCDQIYIFMCSEVKYAMRAPMTGKDKTFLDQEKEAALDNKDAAFEPYRSPQEIYG